MPRSAAIGATTWSGAEIGGALKNVYAIAAGIVVGKKLGASAHAALVTRGFAEMMRFGAALGARRETMTGLSGLGDLVLTCGSPQSRNMSLGIALGEGPEPGRGAEVAPLGHRGRLYRERRGRDGGGARHRHADRRRPCMRWSRASPRSMRRSRRCSPGRSGPRRERGPHGSRRALCALLTMRRQSSP